MTTRPTTRRPYTPFCNLCAQFKGVQLDILYAALAQNVLPEHINLSSHSCLRACDESTVRPACSYPLQMEH
jgi:poly(A) polymerase Pap1